MNQQFLKEIEMGSKNALVKKRIITHYIYNGSSTIPDLSKELNLSVPTVTKFIGEMCEDGYINDYGKLETSGGRHPNLYGLNPESGYFIGVDIKRFAVNIGLINFKGDMVELKMNIPYKFENSIEGMNELCKLILNFIKKLPINKEKILNINVNVSGWVNPESGYSFSQFNFEERPLADVLSEKLGHKVTIDNDTRAMTYGEYMQGCVKGEKILFSSTSAGESASELLSTAKSTQENPVSRESSVTSMHTTMKSSAIAAKKGVWKQKHPALPFIAFFWSVLKAEKALFFPPEYPVKKTPSRLTKSSQPSTRKICFVLKLLKK